MESAVFALRETACRERVAERRAIRGEPRWARGEVARLGHLPNDRHPYFFTSTNIVPFSRATSSSALSPLTLSASFLNWSAFVTGF